MAITTDRLYRLARNLPLVRSLTYQYLPYHVGTVLENRLGSQILRVLWKHLVWRLRPAKVAANVPNLTGLLAVLERDGVLAIPDFLPAEQFAEVRKEAREAIDRAPLTPTRSAKSGRLHVAQVRTSSRAQDFPAITRYLQHNQLIRQLAVATVKRQIVEEPEVSIDLYRQVDLTQPDTDIENILHADLHCPTVKAFFSLNDVDRTNGAFVYARGSHRLTPARLRHEYSLSVRTARLRGGDDALPPETMATRGAIKRNLIAPRDWIAMGVEETTFAAPANTLIVANNMGFHRRGEFSGDRPRETILINFRNLEKWRR